MADNTSAERVEIPRADVRRAGLENKEYRTLIQRLNSLSENSIITCDTSYLSSAHALICNCANEAGNQSLKGKEAVSRVVFSRLKSPKYPRAKPSTIRRVICEKDQFTWTKNGWDPNCNKKITGSRTHFNSSTVRGSVLRECAASIKSAARIELIEKPNELYALNYCSTQKSAYRGKPIPRWCRNMISHNPRVGQHAFGFANDNENVPFVPDVLESSSISFFDYLKKIDFFFSVAEAAEPPKIVNKKSKRKVVYSDDIKKILNSKYRGFKAYNFESYRKGVQVLLKSTRDNLPSSIVGDYNGDGKNDLVIMGAKGKKHLVIAFLSAGASYKDFVVDSGGANQKPFDLYLVNIPKRKIIFYDKKKRDAFQIEKFGGAAYAMLFNGKKFVDNGSGKNFKYK